MPLNYFLLGGATLGESVFLAAVAADLKIMSVFAAIFATCLAVGSLFIAATYTASSMDRDKLIRNLGTALLITFILHLAVIIFFVFGFGI